MPLFRSLVGGVCRDCPHPPHDGERCTMLVRTLGGGEPAQCGCQPQVADGSPSPKSCCARLGQEREHERERQEPADETPKQRRARLRREHGQD